MDPALTAEDVRLLSQWAAGGDCEQLQELLEAPDDRVEAQDAPRRKRKKRPSYLRTRDAKEGLQDEIAELEARLAVLKKRAGLEEEQASVEQTAVQNAVLRGVVHQQHMVMATTHSLLVRRLNKQKTHPLYTPVYLARDWEARRRTLSSMKEVKLRSASQYLMDRSSGLDELLSHASQDVTQDEDGNIICSQFDIHQFANVQSLREVYDATLYYFIHEEIALSERMGCLVILDDFEVVDKIGGVKRMHWIDDNAVTTEWNTVSFAELFDGQYAVLTSDSVDVDERFPFQPASRVRRDWSGAIRLSIAKKSLEDNSVVVVMRRAAITKLLLPGFPLTAEMKATLIKTVFSGSDAMVASIRSQLSSAIPATSSRIVHVDGR